MHASYVCQVTSVMSNSLRPYGPYSPPGSSDHGILQVRILKWVSTRGSGNAISKCAWKGTESEGRTGLFGRVSQVVLVVKNPSANTEDLRDLGLIPGLERSFEEGKDNPLQYSCLENPMDRGAWWVTVHRVTKSQKQLKRLNMDTCTYLGLTEFFLQ